MKLGSISAYVLKSARNNYVTEKPASRDEIPVIVSASGGDHRPTVLIRSDESVVVDCRGNGTAYVRAIDRNALADRLLEVEAAPIPEVERWISIGDDGLSLCVCTDGWVAIWSSAYCTVCLGEDDLSRVARAVRR